MYRCTAVSTDKLREIYNIYEKLKADFIAYISHKSVQSDLYVSPWQIVYLYTLWRREGNDQKLLWWNYLI